MGVSVAKKAALALACLVLFSTCGDLETLFPSNGTYQVRTMVNGSSLEECSIIRANDKIRPYFAVSVVNDPDLIGLLVYLQDPSGKIIGDRVQYTLLPYADETALAEEDLLEAEELEAAEETEETVEPDAESDEENEEPNLPEYQVLERWSFADAKPMEKNTDIEIAVKSLARELPSFPLPKELEIGPYVLVFEAVGKKETLSRTETNVYYLDTAEFNLKDVSMYLSGVSGFQLISPETVIMLEASIDFDSRLDPYVIWYSGKNIISEGRISSGAGKLLWEAPEQAGFYSLRLEAFPVRLKRNAYNGLSREIALPVSPKAISLGYFFENNDEHTARSPLAAGTAYPAAIAEIAAIAAEASVETEVADEAPPEVPLPVSYSAPELLKWYQFEGSLRDSLSTLTDEQPLLPEKKFRPQWAAAGQSYGLSTGPDNPYLLSPIKFFRKEKDQGGGILLFHVRPLSEGIVFSAFFPLQSSLTEGVWMDMIREGSVIALRLSSADAFVDLPVYLGFSQAEGLIPIAVEFYIRPNRLEAKICLDENLQNKTKAGSINLPGALSGEGRIRLGGVTENSLTMLTLAASIPDYETITQTDDADETGASIPVAVETFPNTVWDELAILYSSVPLLPKELVTPEKKIEPSLPPAVQREPEAEIEPAVEEAEQGEAVKAEEADLDDSADPIDPVEEQETQEREEQ
jgi:hypothetical protein